VAPKPLTEAPAMAVVEKKQESLAAKSIKQLLPLVIGGLVLFGLGMVAPASFMAHFTVFVLACFIGYQVIWNVTPSLHTPLMSVTNAISGIIVIGAIVEVSGAGNCIRILSVLAILVASINIAGGFLVTRRMLEMFRK
jgi:NAD(P) transhydrogenase subunit alpha